MASMPTTHAVERELADSPRVRDLCAALTAAAHSEELVLRLLRDLLGFREVYDAASRWSAARLLLEGRSPFEAARELGLSAPVVAELARRVHGPTATYGYRDTMRALGGAPLARRTARLSA